MDEGLLSGIIGKQLMNNYLADAEELEHCRVKRCFSCTRTRWILGGRRCDALATTTK